MSERDALLAGVLNDPADDTARLVLADWLDEHDEGERGRFVRAGVTVARFRGDDLIDDPDYYAALRVVADAATAGRPARWLAALGVGPSPLTHGDWVWDNTADRVTVRIGGVAGVFARGLLSELVLPLADWYEIGPRALAAWPLERATITDAPGLEFAVAPPDDGRPGWRASAAITVRARPRRRGPARRLNALVGTDPDATPPAGRWAADRSFPDRESLARLAGDAWAGMLDEACDAARAAWRA